MSSDFEIELSERFAGEDAALDPAPFQTAIENRITRQRRIRRLILTATGLAGGVLAIVQAPSLLARFAPAAGSISEEITTPLRQNLDQAISDPIWMIVAGCLAITIFMVSALERA